MLAPSNLYSRNVQPDEIDLDPNPLLCREVLPDEVNEDPAAPSAKLSAELGDFLVRGKAHDAFGALMTVTALLQDSNLLTGHAVTNEELAEAVRA